jgi:hypothetical protein
MHSCIVSNLHRNDRPRIWVWAVKADEVDLTDDHLLHTFY